MDDGSASHQAVWQARLDLAYRRSAHGTQVAACHVGPLRVQKPLYPEGPDVCHSIIIHPPGGIAGGDHLAVDIDAAARAHALITTPGAAKWYKANGRRAAQQVVLKVAGALEWLPQEAIVFDQADVRADIAIEIVDDGATIGWDIVVLGRAAAGERFARGAVAQTIRLSAQGHLQWVERMRLVGGHTLLDSPVGLDGQRVIGCLWAWGPVWSDEIVDAVRAELDASAGASVPARLTRVAPRLLIARTMASTTDTLRARFIAVWQSLRPRVFAGKAALAPRIWAT